MIAVRGRLSATRATVASIFASFFEMFDVPVYWPILVVYFFVLFLLTMRRQIQCVFPVFLIRSPYLRHLFSAPAIRLQSHGGDVAQSSSGPRSTMVADVHSTSASQTHDQVQIRTLRHRPQGALRRAAMKSPSIPRALGVCGVLDSISGLVESRYASLYASFAQLDSDGDGGMCVGGRYALATT